MRSGHRLIFDNNGRELREMQRDETAQFGRKQTHWNALARPLGSCKTPITKEADHERW